jgi:hypothetical protein
MSSRLLPLSAIRIGPGRALGSERGASRPTVPGVAAGGHAGIWPEPAARDVERSEFRDDQPSGGAQRAGVQDDDSDRRADGGPLRRAGRHEPLVTAWAAALWCEWWTGAGRTSWRVVCEVTDGRVAGMGADEECCRLGAAA